MLLATTAADASATEVAPAPDKPRSAAWSFLWLDAEVGAGRIALRTLDVDARVRSIGLSDRSAGGPMIGVGFGPRLFLLRLGPRFRAGFFDGRDYFSVGGELGLRVPIAGLEPHFEIGAGYASVRHLDEPGDAHKLVSVSGMYGRAGVGLDLSLSRTFTVGVSGSYELLALTPPGVTVSTLQSLRKDALAGDSAKIWERLPAARGSSYGGGMAIMAVVGVRY